MKIIYPDQTLTVQADAEDGNYPDDNLLDEHPKKLWKGTGASHIVKFTTAAGSEACALFNTNAATIAVTVMRGNRVQWAASAQWTPSAQWYDGEASPTMLYDLNAEGVGRLWAEYMAISGPHIIELVLTGTAGSVLDGGVFVSGPLNTFDDPLYGIDEGLVDYSIVKELNNGATYTRKRDVVRAFGFVMFPERDADFYTFMHSVAMLIGPGQMAWRLCHQTLTGWEWVVYGSMLTMPQGRHSNKTRSQITVSVREVL